MASLNGQYDPEAGVPGVYEVFEAGPNPMEVVESDIVATKAGTGKLLKYKVRITEGDNEDRLVFGQFNLQNPNPVATKIGQEEFRALREVVGVLEPEDTQDLHFKQFIGYVKITPAKGEYAAKNEIDWGKTYKIFTDGVDAVAPPANDNEKPAPAKAAPVKAAAKPAAGAAKAPWPRKAA
jgi:hypothetical protein